MDINTQRLTKTQFLKSSRYQKVQQATLNENLRGLSAEYDILRHQTASEAARLRLKAESFQELASRRTSGSRRLSPRVDTSRSGNSLQASSRRLNLSMNDIDQATVFGQADGHTTQRSRGVYPSSAHCSSDKRAPRSATSSPSDVTTDCSCSSRGGATLTVPRLQVSPDSEETQEQFEALKKCRYLRVRGLDDEALSPEEVFAANTAGDRAASAS